MQRRSALILVSLLATPAAAEVVPESDAPKTGPEIAPTEPESRSEPKREEKQPWYEKLSIRGYAQFRLNRLYATEEDFANPLADRTIAKDNRFSIRRARLIVSGDVNPHLGVYLQTEFAGADAKMRDWYGDIFLDKAKTSRFRIGQSKLPYGFENMQSSSNRLPLDRSDGINSAIPGERDLGAFFYWEPSETRKLFKHLVDSGLKGSGDYGVVGFGVYNGQLVNVDDKNENLHVVGRVSYPIELGDQIIEPGIQGYVGKYTPEVDDDVTIEGDEGKHVRDMRAAASFVLYPKPIGFAAEYNIGKGPELVGDIVRAEKLHGGYALLNARIVTECAGEFLPFVRGGIYEGGIKNVKNTPRHETKELVVGAEWQFRGFELVAEVDHAKRTVGDKTVWGTIARLQLQINY